MCLLALEITHTHGTPASTLARHLMMKVSGVKPTITTACVDLDGSEEQLPSYTRPRPQ